MRDTMKAFRQRRPVPLGLACRLALDRGSTRYPRVARTCRCLDARVRASRGEGSSTRASAAEMISGATGMIEQKQYKKAVLELKSALELDLTDDEARTANYNLACAYSRMRELELVKEPLLRAVNDYGLKYTTVIEDPDLQRFRESRYFDDIQGDIKGGIGSDEQYVKLRAELSSPFRLARLFIFGALDVGAALGLFVIVLRLVSAVRGGEGAPDVGETTKNLAINATAFVVLSALVYREVKVGAEQREEKLEEEKAGQLLVQMDGTRSVPLSRLRQSYRPVVLFGTEEHINKCLKSARDLKYKLAERGVVVIPVRLGKFRTALPKASRGFEDLSKIEESQEAAAAEQVKGPRLVIEADRVDEWISWLDAQKKGEGLEFAEEAWVQVGMDGSIAKVGAGAPSWKALAALPKKDDLRTKVAG